MPSRAQPNRIGGPRIEDRVIVTPAVEYARNNNEKYRLKIGVLEYNRRKALARQLYIIRHPERAKEIQAMSTVRKKARRDAEKLIMKNIIDKVMADLGPEDME